MARKCTTVPGYGACCAAATQGKLGAPFRFTDHTGKQRCGECNIIDRRPSKCAPNTPRKGFQFRFRPNSDCQMGPGGCPALAAAGGGGLITQTIGGLQF